VTRPNRTNDLLHLGEHYICDLSGCNPALLFNAKQAMALFTQAVKMSGLTIVDEGYFEFSPHGFTCFLLLAESHASLHAWPEYGYCAVDLFTCNIHFDTRPLITTLRELFGCRQASIQKVQRMAKIEPLAVAVG
jgi:S-adenosylmethionine decarboxylase